MFLLCVYLFMLKNQDGLLHFLKLLWPPEAAAASHDVVAGAASRVTGNRVTGDTEIGLTLTLEVG